MPAFVRAAEWRPIDKYELAQKEPKVDPSADAEIIFWDVRIEDRLQGSDLSLALNHYVRIKIFTERGKEQYSTVEIPRYGKRSISDVAGRTIKPDGSDIEVKKDAIFDRELLKTKGLKLSGKTFALPNVEVGDIIEYRYRETRDNEVASHMRLYFQREIPMWNVTYHLKPLNLPWLPYTMRAMAFQCTLPPIQQEPNGFFGTSMNNVPAFKEEPSMPPEDQLRSWVLIYYEEDKKIDAEKYWKAIGKQDYTRTKPLMKADDLVKRTAAELTSGTGNPDDKLAALDTFCRTKIRNTNDSAVPMSADERKVLKENHSASDTLKQKAGTANDVDMLFAALASAAGFEARMARVSDRADTFFAPQRPTTYFIKELLIAVQLNEKWIFFDPSSSYLEPGMLRWQHEGQKALISDPKEGFFATTQFLQPARSRRDRRADFKLLEDGSLEGTVTYTYTGHVARLQKERYEEMSPAQREEDWKKSLEARLSTAEISDLEIQNAADPAKPVIVRHKLSVPGYATRTGRRILLQPAFFQRNLGPRFTESSRKWDVYFNYGWSEEDEVTFDLPEGWELDQPTLPSGSNFGKIGSYTVQVQKTTDGRKLIYRRHFEFGRDQTLLLSASAYPQIKKVFDFMQDQDNYTISLKPAVSLKPAGSLKPAAAK
ncbi:MAG TPA: DUF3857 domain-containing protein [Bryobacteraceae bacterium]|nr:DUF3857 domain-containing protein [Bryobacteraceae bacterium]